VLQIHTDGRDLTSDELPEFLEVWKKTYRLAGCIERDAQSNVAGMVWDDGRKYRVGQESKGMLSCASHSTDKSHASDIRRQPIRLFYIQSEIY
jgi:hypothetical protein